MNKLEKQIYEALKENPDNVCPEIMMKPIEIEAFKSLLKEGYVKYIRPLGYQIIQCDECYEIKTRDELDEDDLCSNCRPKTP